MLPVIYEQASFDGTTLSDPQKRFGNSNDQYCDLVQYFEQAHKTSDNVSLGVAAHSLRAVSVESLQHILSALGGSFPMHIHIAEQIKEVEDCLMFSGQRPVHYLFDNFEVNQHWCLVHATHMDESETTQLASSGAVAGLCPTTEANLGDGLFNAREYLKQSGKFGVGSDSHVSVSLREELRWLEYGQRLKHQTRNEISLGPNTSTGRFLLESVIEGGAVACAHANNIPDKAGLSVGKQADIIALDLEHPHLIHRNNDEIIDSWIFASEKKPH